MHETEATKNEGRLQEGKWEVKWVAYWEIWSQK